MATGRREIDQLIEDVTVDCYNDDEERSAFVVAFHELGRAPAPATITGFATDLTGVDDGGDRRGLVAHLRHSGRTHTVALHDVVLSADADGDLAWLLEAYREWCRR